MNADPSDYALVLSPEQLNAVLREELDLLPGGALVDLRHGSPGSRA